MHKSNISTIWIRLIKPQVLDFGAVRNGIPETNRGCRIEVDMHGCEIGGSATRDVRDT
jgi:hypothetical protein